MTKEIIFPPIVHSDTEIIKEVSRLRKGGRVLDLGCAEGRHSMAFSNFGLNPIGLDLEPCVKPGTVPVTNANWERLPFSEDIFDCVTLINSGVDLHSSPTVLEETVRVLKKGGLFVFNTTSGDIIFDEYKKNGEKVDNYYFLDIEEEIPGGKIAHKKFLNIKTLQEEIYETQNFPPDVVDKKYVYTKKHYTTKQYGDLFNDRSLTIIMSWNLRAKTPTIVKPPTGIYYLTELQTSS